MAENYTVLKDFELEEIGNNKWRLKTFIGFDVPECIEIPAEIDGKKIVEIGEKLFFGDEDLEQVKIAEGIRVIGKSAFEDCSRLSAVSFPASLESIEGRAFYECCYNFMPKVEFPQGLKEIGEYAFPDSTQCFIFPIGCKAVLKNNFVRCFWQSRAEFDKKLKEDTKYMDDSESMGVLWARMDAMGSYKMYIPSTVSVEKLADLHGWDSSFVTVYCHAGSSAMIYARKHGIKCFDYDKELAEFKQQEEKLAAEKKAEDEAERFRNLPLSERDTIFEGDFPKDIENVIIPAHVKIIKKQAFYGYTYRRLHSISFAPNSQLEIIEDRAFESCEIKMDKLIIPKSVKKIGERAFNFSCSAHPDVELVFEDGSMLEEIGDSAFEGLSFKCKDVKKVYELKLPKHIRKIGKGAFQSNERVGKVNMSACTELRTLPQGMFEHCSNLTQVVLPPNLEIMEGLGCDKGGCFYYTGITSLTLPASCKKVEKFAFSQSFSLKRLIVPEDCEVEESAVTDGCKVIRKNVTLEEEEKVPKGGFMSKLKGLFKK